MSVYKDLDINVNELLDTTEDIDKLLIIWNEIDEAKKLAVKTDERIKVKIKTFLKEKQWEDYKDKETKIHVKLGLYERKTLDKEEIKKLLTSAQLAQVTRITSYEKLSIITQENRERLKKIVRKKN